MTLTVANHQGFLLCHSSIHIFQFHCRDLAFHLRCNRTCLGRISCLCRFLQAPSSQIFPRNSLAWCWCSSNTQLLFSHLLAGCQYNSILKPDHKGVWVHNNPCLLACWGQRHQSNRICYRHLHSYPSRIARQGWCCLQFPDSNLKGPHLSMQGNLSSTCFRTY